MSPTVVVADDDPDIRALVELAVVRAGHTVLASVADGVAALSAASLHRPDLLILDVSMPKMSGLQVCEQLRANPATAGLRVLILSADAQHTAVQAGLDAGAGAYLPKPFSLRELRAQITELLSGTPS